MKKILLLSTGCLFVFSCANNADKTASTSSDTTKVAAASTTTTTPVVDYPYTATYSSQMEAGDPNNTKKVLDIYKDYDNGNLLAHKDYFADSIVISLSNGNSVKGTRDSVLNMIQKERSNMKAVEDKIITFISTHSKDKGDNWVSIWTKEIDTHKDGKIDSNYLNESWLLNKDGKISYMTQYSKAANPPKEAKKK